MDLKFYSEGRRGYRKGVEGIQDEFNCVNRNLELEMYKIFLKLKNNLMEIQCFTWGEKRQGWKEVFNSQLRNLDWKDRILMAFKTLYQFIKDTLPDPFVFYWRHYEQQKHTNGLLGNDIPLFIYTFTLLFKVLMYKNIF